LMDAKYQGLATIDDPRLIAKRTYSMVLGTLLYAKIRNSLDELDDLESSVMGIIGAREPAL